MTPWERISALMEERGTTNKELADFIQTRPQTITDWKKGKTQSYTKFYQQIAAYFGVSVDYLAGNSPYKMPDTTSEDPNAAYKMPESAERLGINENTPRVVPTKSALFEDINSFSESEYKALEDFVGYIKHKRDHSST